MTHLVLATPGGEWARDVYERVRGSGAWTYRLTDGADARVREVVHARRWRYIFCVNYSAIIPADIVAQHEVVNFHCTPLPYGRGGGPIENMIRRGWHETIITAHRMTADIDAGPIYGVSSAISLAGTKAQITARFVAPVVDMIRYIVEQQPAPVPQEQYARFRRLPQAEHDALWAQRERA